MHSCLRLRRNGPAAIAEGLRAPHHGPIGWNSVCQTIEYGAGWTAADAVNIEGGRAIWTRRVSFHVDVPYQGAVEAVFVDADWGADRSALSTNVSAGYERKVKKPVTGQDLRMAAARYAAPAPVAFGDRLQVKCISEPFKGRPWRVTTAFLQNGRV